MTILIRDYQRDDATVTAEIFRMAVRITASRDYSPAQVMAWAPDDIDLDAWHSGRQGQHTYVAIEDGEVVGFTGLTADGVLDMLFVDPPSGRARHRPPAGGARAGPGPRRRARRGAHAVQPHRPARVRAPRLRGGRRERGDPAARQPLPNFDMHVDLG